MLNTIRLQSEAISLEAFNVKASMALVRKMIPNFIQNVTNFLENLTLNEKLAVALVQDSKLQKLLKDVKYVDVRKMEVYAPQGLKVSYLEYLRALEDSVVMAERLMPNVLVPFSNWLAMKLATPEALGSQRDNNMADQTKDSGLATAKASLERAVNKANTQQKFLYGKLVQRNSDWSDVVKSTNDLLSRYMATNPKQVREKVEEITTNLNTLIARMEEDPETYKLSGITAAGLAKQCYVMGREVEYYSVVGYLMQELSNTVQHTVQQLEETFSR